MRADVLALDLPMNVTAPGLARRAVEELDLEAGQRECVSLVVSELVTNAVLHSGAAITTSIRMTARIVGDMLRLSVTDRGTTADAVRPREKAELDGGYGLVLVDRIAARWGVERDGMTTVWCEFAVGRGGRPDDAVPAGRHPRRTTSFQRAVPSA